MKRGLLHGCLLLAPLGALAVLTVTLAQEPSRQRYARASALAAEAQKLSGQGRRGESQQRLDEARALSPENPKVHRERGLQLLARRRMMEGAAELRIAAEAQPGDAGAAWELAFALSAAGQTEESITWFARVAHMQRNNGAAYAMIATGNLQLNRLPQALAAARTGVQLSPRIPLTWFTLGLVHWQNQDYDQARRALEQAHSRRPSDARTLLALGAVAADAQQPDLAAQYLEEAVRVAPRDAACWTALGKVYRLTRQLEKAEQAFLRAQALAPP